jgi:SAM-dependent methyltransferase
MIDFDPGSFKDPAGRVFHHEGWVYRTLSAGAQKSFQAATDAGLIQGLVKDGLLVSSELLPASALGLPAGAISDHVLRQPRIPVVTYPYEWSFEMLRDAALVTLRVIERALAAGFILKDATSFNILFEGNVPKLVDTPSIEPYRDGDLWAGYGQFCRCFLFPLLVTSYRGVDMQALLRGAFGEVPVREAARMLRFRDYSKPGVFKDVVLQARLDSGFARSGATIKTATSDRSYPKLLLVSNVQRLTKLIEGLEGPRQSGDWTRYDTFHTYTEADRSAKAAFVARALAERPSASVVDLGCNTGEYSQIALRSGAAVVAVDLDPGAIDRLYRGLSGPTPLSPIVSSLLNPTPAMGWGLRERRSLFERIASDRFLALALIHHLRITGGVPLDAILTQLFAIAPEGVIEWVDKEDAMVREMLALRPDVYGDYTSAYFESALRERADIAATQPTHDGKRRLYHVRRNSSPRSEAGRTAW